MESRRDIRQAPLSFEVQFASGNPGKPAAAHFKGSVANKPDIWSSMLIGQRHTKDSF